MKSSKQTTFDILDGYKPGYRFKGIDLMFQVQFETGKIHYPDSMLRYMREYRQRTGRKIENVNKAKSIYEVVG